MYTCMCVGEMEKKKRREKKIDERRMGRREGGRRGWKKCY